MIEIAKNINSDVQLGNKKVMFKGETYYKHFVIFKGEAVSASNSITGRKVIEIVQSLDKTITTLQHELKRHGKKL